MQSNRPLVFFLFAWLFQSVRFYPGNPVETASIYCGFSLSAAALLTASFGLKRLMGIIIKLGSALVALVKPFGGLDLEIKREKKPAKPADQA